MNNHHGHDAQWHLFLNELRANGSQFVHNAPFHVTQTSLDDVQAPVIWNTANSPQTSWVCSLLNSYGPYARAEFELVNTPKIMRPFYGALSFIAQQLLQTSGLGGGVFLDNWYLATNLYPSNRSAQGIIKTVQGLVSSAKKQPIIIRSLTQPLHKNLMQELIDAGFLLIPTRQVWIANTIADGSWRKHSDVKKDLKIEKQYASQSEWIAGEQFSDADYDRCIHLYNELYRGKYPQFNPDYTKAFFKTACQTGFMKLYGLRFENAQSLSGVVGVIQRSNVFATPILGYDLTRPQHEGLYRRLMLKAFLETENHQGILHCSAGAGNFKKQRGANFHTEFAAVWMKHLSTYRQASFKTLTKTINTFITPYMEKNEL